VRFSLLGMFSASFPMIGIGTFCAVHTFLILIILTIFTIIAGVGPIHTLSEYCGSCCNKAADLFFHVCDVVLSSLFSFLDFDEKRYKKWPKIYYVVYCYVIISIYYVTFRNIYYTILFIRSLLLKT